ncbi:acyl carrier protein [Streptomyces sp. NPDC057307]|uniref:acyl carrier protein n=1 Tax=Streptomyces sp. NPDC057307 TaxID=3346096 RepID=UPI00363BDE2C
MADARMTVDDLKRILLEAGGEDEGTDLSGDIGEVAFDALGYDSLALLEATSRIQREYDLELEDEVLAEAGTPSALIGIVNERLAASASA